jgi:apolipoprotein N-acyltransferase
MSFSMLVDFSTYWLFFILSILAIPLYFCVCYMIPQIYLLHILRSKYNLSKLSFYFCAVIMWFAFEMLRSSSLFLIDFQGFNWGLLGYNLFVSDNLAQLFSVTGVYLASLIVAFLYGLLFLCVDQDFKIFSYKRFFCFLSFLVIIILTVNLYGINRINTYASGERDLKYLIVHPSITKHHNFKYENALNNLNNQIDLANNSNSYYDLVVMPEGGINFPIDTKDEVTVFNYIAENVTNYQYLVAGGTRVDGDKYYNSLFVSDNEGQIIDFYDKRYLVPFGEYVPYFKIFDLPLTNNISGFAFGQLRSLSMGDFVFKPLICYDGLYTNSTLTNDFDFVVNISNDIWFSQKFFGVKILSAAYQHLDIVRARAIEVATPVIRSTNLGVSSVLDARGRVVKMSSPYRKGIIEGVLQYGAKEDTIYEKLMFSF